MLAHLHIENFALIKSLDLRLYRGLQVITGETGAGKSILLGALRMILGVRAEQKNIADTQQKTIVEATFEVDQSYKPFFKKNELDFDTECLIRREISPSGKSRAFINDTPVTLDVLKDLSSSLLDIHSQFETSKLFTEDFQFSLLDSVARNAERLSLYRDTLKVWNNLKSQLKHLHENKAKLMAEREYHLFLLHELENLNLDDINEQEILYELENQENIESLTDLLSQIIARSEAEEVGTVANMTDANHKLKKLAEISGSFTELSGRMESVAVEFKDILQELEERASTLERDPARLEELLSLQGQLQQLFTKHQVKSVEELILKRDELRKNTQSFDSIEEEIATLELLRETQEKKLKIEASELSKARKEAIPGFNSQLEKTFARLGLAKARFDIKLEEDEKFTLYGKERIQYVFQANAGYGLLPLSQAISGGERSRVMLAIKKMMADHAELPTLILDEIDSGVSGRVAEEIGIVMQEMSIGRQLIVITHQAQVAAKGSHQYRVEKEEIEGITQSRIRPLSTEERRTEIAQLISGNTLTEAALQQAEELMKS